MNKIIAFAAAASFAAGVFAADNVDADFEVPDDEAVEEAETSGAVKPSKDIGVWPAFFAICEIPSAQQVPDIVGIRITIPYSTKHESVTGFDVGLWGRARHFEGFMLNILRNDVKDELAGLQAGLYNSAVQADKVGLQVGLWNEAGSMSGDQRLPGDAGHPGGADKPLRGFPRHPDRGDQHHPILRIPLPADSEHRFLTIP